ncbi:MAG: hypothetical protein JXR97_13110 [Planctomycetes bacterium]|nr:hypothetical protein [Planctomycetota bacterium]
MQDHIKPISLFTPMSLCLSHVIILLLSMIVCADSRAEEIKGDERRITVIEDGAFKDLQIPAILKGDQLTPHLTIHVRKQVDGKETLKREAVAHEFMREAVKVLAKDVLPSKDFISNNLILADDCELPEIRGNHKNSADTAVVSYCYNNEYNILISQTGDSDFASICVRVCYAKKQEKVFGDEAVAEMFAKVFRTLRMKYLDIARKTPTQEGKLFLGPEKAKWPKGLSHRPPVVWIMDNEVVLFIFKDETENPVHNGSSLWFDMLEKCANKEGRKELSERREKGEQVE